MYFTTSTGTEKGKDVEIKTHWKDADRNAKMGVYMNIGRTIDKTQADDNGYPHELFLESADVEEMASKGVFSLESVKRIMESFGITALKLSPPVEDSADRTGPEIRGLRGDGQWIRPGIEYHKRSLIDLLIGDLMGK